MARLWSADRASIAGNPNSPANRAKPKSMKNHHASRDREQGRTTSARSRAMRSPASVTGITVALTASAIAPYSTAGVPFDDHAIRRETNATHP